MKLLMVEDIVDSEEDLLEEEFEETEEDSE